MKSVSILRGLVCPAEVGSIGAAIGPYKTRRSSDHVDEQGLYE